MLPTQKLDVTLYSLTQETELLDTMLVSSAESPEEIAEIQDRVQALLQTKVDSCKGYVEFLQDKEWAIDNAIEKLQAMKSTVKNRREGFLHYVRFCMTRMNVSELRGTMGKITLSPPTKVIKVDEKLVPVEFLEVEKKIKVKKMEIKELLKQGQTIPGAWLEEGERPLRFAMNTPTSKKKEVE